MTRKVKLPKGICAYLDRLLMEYPGFKDQYPFAAAVGILREKRSEPSTDELQNEFAEYVNLKSDNQWKLIDALHYGYEPEPEPRWGIKAGNCYMYDSDSWTFTTILNLVIKSRCWWVEKKDALDTVTLIGFGEVVDLNKEGKADEQ